MKKVEFIQAVRAWLDRIENDEDFEEEDIDVKDTLTMIAELITGD